MSEYQYNAIFEPAPEGGYTVTVPALPGCVSEGNTLEEAKANIQEAIELYLDVYLEDHTEVPREKRQPIISSIGVRVAVH